MYSKSFKDIAIVLKNISFGESSKLITLFTKNQGKIKVIARGSRKIKSKIGGRIEPFNYGIFYIVKGKTNYTLTTVDIYNNFNTLRQNLIRIAYAFSIIDIVDKLTFEEDVHLKLFNLLYATLQFLGKTSKLDTLYLYFILFTLKYLGFGLKKEVYKNFNLAEKNLIQFLDSKNLTEIMNINIDKNINIKGVNNILIFYLETLAEKKIFNINNI